ncbi:hypothetical protein C8024_04150 [Sphingopyxis sp. BSNA05]|nr:hypothetical protein [Sphingopyxis sp. BSNA05]
MLQRTNSEGNYIMNTVKRTALFALAVSAIATTPAVAAEEKASFQFVAQELQSESSRERMMMRLEREARSYCRSGNYSVLIPRHSLSKCSDAIKTQWMTAIDSVEMSGVSAHAGTELADARP